MLARAARARSVPDGSRCAHGGALARVGGGRVRNSRRRTDDSWELGVGGGVELGACDAFSVQTPPISAGVILYPAVERAAEVAHCPQRSLGPRSRSESRPSTFLRPLASARRQPARASGHRQPHFAWPINVELYGGEDASGASTRKKTLSN